MSTSISIQPLSRRTFGAALSLCTALNDAAPHGIPSDADSIKEVLTNIGNGNGCVLVAYVDDLAAGVVGGIAYPSWVNRRVTVGQELFWYVAPEQRHKGVGRRLMEAFITDMKERGCDQVVMVSIGDKRADSSFLAQGFLGAETNYFYKVDRSAPCQ